MSGRSQFRNVADQFRGSSSRIAYRADQVSWKSNGGESPALRSPPLHPARATPRRVLELYRKRDAPRARGNECLELVPPSRVGRGWPAGVS